MSLGYFGSRLRLWPVSERGVASSWSSSCEKKKNDTDTLVDLIRLYVQVLTTVAPYDVAYDGVEPKDTRLSGEIKFTDLESQKRPELMEEWNALWSQVLSLRTVVA